MNINGDQWRAGTGCHWMAFCSASDSSAPLMGSGWLDSIMSPDTLWRGCKLSIRPLSSPPMLPDLFLLSPPHSLWSSCHHSPCSYFPFSLLRAFYIPTPTRAFMLGLSWSASYVHTDMKCAQVDWSNEQRQSLTHVEFKGNMTCLGLWLNVCIALKRLLYFSLEKKVILTL